MPELQRLIECALQRSPPCRPRCRGRACGRCSNNAFPKGLALVPQQKVQRLELGDSGTLSLRDSYGDVTVEATLILATGRFLRQAPGPGRQCRFHQSLLGLPVTQPDGRSGLYTACVDPRGHAVNRAGVEVERFRPLGTNGQPLSTCSPPVSYSHARTGSASAAALDRRCDPLPRHPAGGGCGARRRMAILRCGQTQGRTAAETSRGEAVIRGVGASKWTRRWTERPSHANTPRAPSLQQGLVMDPRPTDTLLVL